MKKSVLRPGRAILQPGQPHQVVRGTVPLTRPDNGPPAPTSNGRSASFIWCHWGNNALTTAGQETTRLVRAMRGYDHKVLLKHNQTPGWIDFSEADERNADVMRPPTPANFTDELVRLAQEGYVIDIYIFAHGYSDGFTGSTGTFHDGANVTGSRIRDLPAAAGLRALPIRMVYQTQCDAAALNDDWRAAGAKASTGARDTQYYPVRFGRFIDDWHDGDAFGPAATRAVTTAMRTAAQSYILADALATRGSWGSCPMGKTVLGKGDCAREYHTRRQQMNTWQDGLSGKENMNRSSTMLVSGNRTLTKSSMALTW
ncbi:MAG: hypothetical protein R3D85_07970 [Paracoccaceae bacterium]